jgi:cytochrome c553
MYAVRPIALLFSLSAAVETAAAAERPAQIGLCMACHQDDGRAGPPGTPRLAGQDETYLRLALEAYRSGERKHGPMRAIVGALQADDITALARWYANQPACKP